MTAEGLRPQIKDIRPGTHTPVTTTRESSSAPGRTLDPHEIIELNRTPDLDQLTRSEPDTAIGRLTPGSPVRVIESSPVPRDLAPTGYPTMLDLPRIEDDGDNHHDVPKPKHLYIDTHEDTGGI